MEIMEILIMRCKAKVAILMATYNGEKYLKEQIESIPQFSSQVQR